LLATYSHDSRRVWQISSVNSSLPISSILCFLDSESEALGF
jgi:hypothetical protein